MNFIFKKLKFLFHFKKNKKMLRVFILLTFLLSSNALYRKTTPVVKKTIMNQCKIDSHHIKKIIQVFNIIDIIQPNSISKWIQYKLFLKDAYIIFVHNIKEELYEKNLNFDIDLFVFTSIGIFLYYLYNSQQINKMNIFEKEKDTKDCLYNFDILISFISYFLFKDVLSAS